MHPYGAPPTEAPGNRPTISDVIDGPDGRHFTISFGPGQKLPVHRNASRILITTVLGSGEFTLADGTVTVLSAGGIVQVDPDVPHAVVAGDDGLEITVHLIAGCCGVC